MGEHLKIENTSKAGLSRGLKEKRISIGGSGATESRVSSSSAPSTPISGVLRRDNSVQSTSSGGGLKKLFHKHRSTPDLKKRHSAHEHITTSTPRSSAGDNGNKFKRTFESLSPVLKTWRRNSLDLPPITSVRSRENKHKKHFARDQSSTNTDNDHDNDRDSMEFTIAKSEANSVLNLNLLPQLSVPHSSELMLHRSDVSQNSQMGSSHSRLTSSEASQQGQQDHDAGNKGLLSTLITAAADHLPAIVNYEDLSFSLAKQDTERTMSGDDTGTISPKHEAKSKLGDVLTSLRNLAGNGNGSREQLPHVSDQYDNKQPPQSHAAPDITVNGSPIPRGIAFELMKQTPLSTLGKGELRLADFERRDLRTTRADHISPPRTSVEIPGTLTIARVMSPNGRAPRLDVSPGSGRPPLASPAGRTARFSLEGESRKRVGRRMSRKNNSSLDENRPVKTDSNDTGDEISPVISKVLTNGQSRTRGRSRSIKLTIATQKRQAEFHLMFKQIPVGEKLLDDYSCALQKEILVQGRLYMTTAHLCFNSNILGWVTNLVIPFLEIIQIEKKNTAALFPNAISVQTLYSKSFFASFLARDATFDAITSVWNQNIHTGDRGSISYLYESDKDLDSGDESDDESDTDDDTDDNSLLNGQLVHETDTSSTSEIAELESPLLEDSESKMSNDGGENADAGSANEFNGIVFEGPKEHAPTENGLDKKPSETIVLEDTIAAPLGVVYQILFGDDTSYLRNILAKSKNFDISEIPKFSKASKKRQYSYIKPLGGPVGPKQTKCNITETVESCDFNSCVRTTQVSLTPDVPSGSNFTVRSLILLSWTKNNSTKIVVVTAVDWTGKSWIKSAIEKGSIDGQKEAMKVLVAEVRNIVSSPLRKRSTTVSKRKKKAKEPEIALELEPAPEPEPEQNPVVQMMKMVSDMLPVPEFIKPFVNLFLVAMVVITFWSLRSRHADNSVSFSNVKLAGRDYILLPNTYQNGNYLSNKLEYDIWNWIDKRNGENDSLRRRHGGLDGGHGGVDDRKRKNLEDLVKITQQKLDELKKMLSEDT